MGEDRGRDQVKGVVEWSQEIGRYDADEHGDGKKDGNYENVNTGDGLGKATGPGSPRR